MQMEAKNQSKEIKEYYYHTTEALDHREPEQ